ncbi:hypothetical protein ACTXT7_009252 [Hymenolepis weldensis]
MSACKKETLLETSTTNSRNTRMHLFSSTTKVEKKEKGRNEKAKKEDRKRSGHLSNHGAEVNSNDGGPTR